MLSGEIYSENCMKPITTFCEYNTDLLIIKAGGTHSYRWALKG
jgi:hypothetical protein